MAQSWEERLAECQIDDKAPSSAPTVDWGALVDQTGSKRAADRVAGLRRLGELAARHPAAAEAGLDGRALELGSNVCRSVRSGKAEERVAALRCASCCVLACADEEFATDVGKACVAPIREEGTPELVAAEAVRCIAVCALTNPHLELNTNCGVDTADDVADLLEQIWSGEKARSELLISAALTRWALMRSARLGGMRRAAVHLPRMLSHVSLEVSEAAMEAIGLLWELSIRAGSDHPSCLPRAEVVDHLRGIVSGSERHSAVSSERRCRKALARRVLATADGVYPSEHRIINGKSVDFPGWRGVLLERAVRDAAGPAFPGLLTSGDPARDLLGISGLDLRTAPEKLTKAEREAAARDCQSRRKAVAVCRSRHRRSTLSSVIGEANG
eukprot:TRINITY_DN65944_c0_g1_i1.p1 TRINITY_DN65944_c0_g1~~TRINITY_DN65944_c0_g1_i1.p1  ORF type:complete len:416 (+),score=126.62 TRINITY_DN65944_c0_g1_i1:88-1248(+)